MQILGTEQIAYFTHGRSIAIAPLPHVWEGPSCLVTCLLDAHILKAIQDADQSCKFIHYVVVFVCLNKSINYWKEINGKITFGGKLKAYCMSVRETRKFTVKMAVAKN